MSDSNQLTQLQKMCLERYVGSYGDMAFTDVMEEAERAKQICGDLGVFDPAYKRFLTEANDLYRYAELLGRRDGYPEEMYCRQVEAVVAVRENDADGYTCWVPLYVTHAAVETYVKRHYAKSHRLTDAQVYNLQLVIER